MAIYSGQSGTLTVAGVNLAELRSFSVDTTTEALQTTTMGDTAHTYIKGLEGFSGSADVFYDDTHVSTIASLAGGTDPVVIAMYPAGEAGTGLPKLTGSAVITGYSVSSSFDGVVEASITFQGTGDLSHTTDTVV